MSAPGWYDDPWSPERLRWWDGTRWTPHATPRPTRQSQLRPPRPPHPALPLPLALATLATIVGSLVASRFLLRWLSDYEWPVVVYVAIAAVLGYGPVLAVTVWISRRWGRGRWREDVGLFLRAADPGWGVLTWVCCFGAQMVVGAVVMGFDIPFTSNTEGVDDLSANRGYVIALLIVAVVAAPIVEEIVFRGVVMKGFLSVMPVWLAVAAQGVVFGCAHYDPVRGSGNIGLILVLSGVGMVLGGAAYLYRRIGPTIVAHAVINAIAMTISLLTN